MSGRTSLALCLTEPVRQAQAAVAEQLTDTLRGFFPEPDRQPVFCPRPRGGPDTQVVTVPEAICGRDRQPDGGLRLHFGGSAAVLPPAAAQAFTALSSRAGGWCADDVVGAGDLDHRAAIELVTGLVRAGAVRIAEPR